MTIHWIDKMAVDVEGEGEGEAVVMLHGLGGSMNVWAPLMPALQNYKVIRIDTPGAGRSKHAYALSENTSHKGQLSCDVVAQSVIDVCKELGVNQAHLVGHSLTTMVCPYVAVKAPKLVKSISLFASMAQPSQAVRDGMRARAPLVRAKGNFEAAVAVSNAALSASTKEMHPVAVAYVRESIMGQDAEGYARNCLLLAEATPTTLEDIQCPMLLITGDEDVVTPLASARELMARVPQARLEVLNKCGHWPMLERPDQCQRILRDFLQAHSRGQA
ncbi:alpha/beta hydrolase [Variovorax sp. PCZ-1]|uniref:alpha/beta fold hydrolase n=1 Tax=Variovorax sp. PCZ-1 TaxID=2835533 RepID=UPI001BCCA6DA|nr:alpha/beta hydrolase [Variovorax sp. PCZ-1]MBS7806023.1 alpha/beta fold hydrolase [Variovorax sp. PCZ-1]